MSTFTQLILAVILFSVQLSIAQNNIVSYDATPMATADYVAPRGGLEAPDQLYNRATLEEKTGDFNAAIDLYSQLLDAHPNHTDARFNRALLYFDMGRFAQSIYEFELLIIQNNNDAEAHEMRGLALLEIGHTAEALLDFNQAYQLSNKTKLLLYRGMANARLGNYKEAMEDLDIVLAKNNDHTQALAVRGDVLLSLERYQAALHWYDRSLAIQPHDPATLFNRGVAYFNMEKYDDAIADLQKAAFIREDAATYLNLAYCYFQKNDLTAAQQFALKSLRLNPDEADTYYLIGLLEMEAEEWEAALESFDIAVSTQPDNTGYLLSRAESYLATEKYYMALEDIKTIAQFGYDPIAVALEKEIHTALEAHNVAQLNAEPLLPFVAEDQGIDIIEEKEDEFYEDPYGMD